MVAVAIASISGAAQATCTQVATTVTCVGAAPLFAPSFASGTNNLTVNVQPGATIGALLGDALTLTGNNVTLNNAGTIDPSLLGLLTVLGTGTSIGVGNPGTVNVTNAATGVMRGTSGLLGINLLDLSGMALAVNNGPTGITSIRNDGTIGSTALLGLTVLGSDMPVVAAYGGATVNMVNTGTITGRVAFERSNAGNSFVNSGTISGSVSMGPTSTNRFTAVTGSAVNNGGSLGLNVLNVVGLNLGFAATGVVDGGAGGDNELILQNSAVGTGAGTGGAGTVPAGTYINFNRLTVNSGTWTLNGGPLVSGTQTLNGGLVNFDNAGVFGATTLFANGGAIAPSVSGLVVATPVALSGTGLAVQGANDLTLSGVLSGAGSIGKSGTGTLTLSGSNTYAGGTDLSAGVLRLGNAAALGTGALRAVGGTLDVPSPATLANAVVLGGNLALTGTSALTLTGAISGAGGLTKNGAADLTLAGANTFAGGLALAGGRLILANGSTPGTGPLTAAAGTSLDALAAVTLTNAVTVNGPFILGGSAALTLAGPVGGAGGLIKNGAADLALAGSNTFAGGVALNAGRLVAGSNAALGTGALTAAAGTTLDASAPVTLANNVALAGNLTLGGSSPMTLSGSVSGAGGLIKAGAADVTLSGVNAFTGPVSVVAGALNTVGNSALGNPSAIDIGAGGALRLGGNASAGALGGAGALDVGAGATLTLGATGAGSTFDGTLSGAGNLAKAGAGTLVLNGAGGVGSTVVNAGRLLVGDATHSAAALGGAVSVASGATLGGTGTAGGNVTVNAGGTLAPGDGLGTLRVGGALTLAQGSVLDMGLGAASGSATVTGVADSVTVAGDLAINGSTLNLSDLGGYGPGLYRLFDYGGTLSLTNGGLVLGTTPGGTPILQYLGAAKQINLVNAAGFTLGMWNANGAASASQMGGGSGVWSATSPVWTDAVGSVTAPMQPMPGFAIFGGTPGTVTVDNGAGAVSATGLQFAVGGYLVTGAPLTLVGTGGTPVPVINVGDGSPASAGYVATIDSVLAGSAGFDKIGAGTLVLNGTNSFTGNAVLSAGVVSIASDAALGAPGNGIDFAGGTLRITGTADNGSARIATLGIAGGAIDIADAANIFTMTQPIGGAGALTKAGAGTLVLAADNTYSGGTGIAAGTLQIGAGGTTGSITGNVLNNGVLAFDRSDALAFNGTISGSGSVNQIGTGTLTLGAANSYAGGTTVTAGTLIGSATSFGSGTITNNAALVLDQGADAGMANTLAGTGSITKSGAGNLTLSGSSGAFAGATEIAAGTLTVQGALGGTLGVASGATLAGSGTVGTTTVRGGGTIAPGVAGGGIGTLTVNGSLVLAPGSTYRLDASPTASDRIQVSGTATLQGGPALALAATGTWNAAASYNILEATGGLGGTFGAVSSNFAFLTPVLSYTPTSASLSLARNDVDFQDVGVTPNQVSAGAGAQSAPVGSPVYNAVVQLDAASARSAFEQIAGEIHASARSAMLEGSHFVRDAAVDALRGGEGAAVAPADASDKRADRNLWVRSFGSWGRTSADGNATRLDSATAGVLIGVDMPVGAGWRAGVLGGYSRGKYEADDRRASSTDDAYHLGIYGGTRWDRLALRLGAFYTRHDVESQRTVVFPGFADSLRADYHARTAQVFGELGYRIDAGSVALEPFANLAYVDLRSNGFTERGGASALSARGDSTHIASSTLGLRAATPISAGRADLTLRGMVGWRHAFGDVTPTATLALAGGSDFEVTGLPVARNALVLEAGFDAVVGKNMTLGVGYAGQAGSGRRDHGLKANLLWKF